MKPIEKKSANVSLQVAITELECEVNRIADLEPDPGLRHILASRIDLSIAEIADSIEKQFIEGNVVYNSKGAPDPAQSTIAAKELPRLLDFIRRASGETKTIYLSQHDAMPPSEGTQAYIDQMAAMNLGFYSAVARDVGRVVDWNYWASQRWLTPREIACLTFELDPKYFDDIHASDKRLFSAGALADEVDNIERSAIRDTEGKNLSSQEWIKWAQGKGYAVSEKFIKAVAEGAQSAPGVKVETVKSNAPQKFSGALGRLLAEIEKRSDGQISRNAEMPGTKEQLRYVAGKFDPESMTVAPTTFDDYIAGVVRFKKGRQASGAPNPYAHLFPEYFASNAQKN